MGFRPNLHVPVHNTSTEYYGLEMILSDQSLPQTQETINKKEVVLEGETLTRP